MSAITDTTAPTSSNADAAHTTQPNSFASPVCGDADLRPQASSAHPIAPTATAITTPPQVCASSG